MQVKKILDELFQFSNEREWFEYKENWFEPVALGEYVSAISNAAALVGKEYGYTGNTCPILCLNRLWDIYSKKGTKIIICTVGAGYSIIVQLYEF